MVCRSILEDSPKARKNRVSNHVCGQNYGQIPVLAQKKSPVTAMVTGLFTGAVGGIRTLVPLLTTTRFPVVLVMTTSIPLHLFYCDNSINYYSKSCGIVKGKIHKTAGNFETAAGRKIPGREAYPGTVPARRNRKYKPDMDKHSAQSTRKR